MTNMDRRHFVSVTRDAVDSGALGATTFLPLAPHVPIYEYNFNDCLILSMLVLPASGTALERAISPIIPTQPTMDEFPAGYPPYGQCQQLFSALNNPSPGVYYHRYLHGDWVLAKGLLSVLSFRSGTNLLLLILCSLIAATAITSTRSAWLGSSLRPRDLSFLSVSIVLAVFYAVPAYDRSLSFAPSDIILVGFVFFSYMHPLSTLAEAKFVTAIAVFGSLTAIFEFFIGAIPAGAVVILGMLALDPSLDKSLIRRRAFVGLFCFMSAIALCLAGKAIAVFAAWGREEIFSSGAELGRWLGNTGWDIAAENLVPLKVVGIDPDTIKSSRILSSAFALVKIIASS